MYCSKCHYGSAVCKLPLSGTSVCIPAVRDTPEIELPERRCPRCGTVGMHSEKAPWSANRTRSIHPARSGKGFTRQKSEDMHADVTNITGGNVKALDYSKNAPAV